MEALVFKVALTQQSLLQHPASDNVQVHKKIFQGALGCFLLRPWLYILHPEVISTCRAQEAFHAFLFQHPVSQGVELIQTF